MYSEMERLVAMTDKAEQERDAWAQHARGLARKLLLSRRRVAQLERALAAAGVSVPPAPVDAAADVADEDAAQLAALMAHEAGASEAAEADGRCGSRRSCALCLRQPSLLPRGTVACLYVDAAAGVACIPMPVPS